MRYCSGNIHPAITNDCGVAEVDDGAHPFAVGENVGRAVVEVHEGRRLPQILDIGGQPLGVHVVEPRANKTLSRPLAEIAPP